MTSIRKLTRNRQIYNRRQPLLRLSTGTMGSAGGAKLETSDMSGTDRSKDEFETLCEFYNAQTTGCLRKLVSRGQEILDRVDAGDGNAGISFAEFLRVKGPFEDLLAAVTVRGGFGAHTHTGSASYRELAHPKEQPTPTAPETAVV
jgi:hypothetical protein